MGRFRSKYTLEWRDETHAAPVEYLIYLKQVKNISCSTDRDPQWFIIDKYSKLPECVVHHKVFTAGALEVRARRVLSGHPLGKPNDVLRIISTHEGSFIFIIHPT